LVVEGRPNGRGNAKMGLPLPDMGGKGDLSSFGGEEDMICTEF